MRSSTLCLFFLFFGIAVFASPNTHVIPIVPDPELTPGHLCDENDPDFVEHRYPEQIPWCKRNVWPRDRHKAFDAYNIPRDCRPGHTPYIIDHMIPLSIGGSNSAKNLWPEFHLVGKHWGDLEFEMYQKLAAGEISQAEAIETIVAAKTGLVLDLSHVQGCGEGAQL